MAVCVLCTGVRRWVACRDRKLQQYCGTGCPAATVPKFKPTTFAEYAAQWKELILPKYRKHSTRKHHADILEGKLVPFFGRLRLDEITGEHVLRFIQTMENRGYAPHSIHHYHAVLSAVLSMAVEWKRIERNPAFGARLPQLRPVRDQSVLTYEQAGRLLKALPIRPRVAVTLALTGMRRGELFAARWKDFDEKAASLTVLQAVYDRVVDTPKTPKSVRTIPLAPMVVRVLQNWRHQSKRTKPEDFMLAGRLGVPGDGIRMLRDHVKSTCECLGLKPATWLTFRKTWSTWADENNISPKIRGELLGHSPEINQAVYTKVVDQSLRLAVERVGSQFEQLCATCAQTPSYVN
jgi:integrase